MRGPLILLILLAAATLLFGQSAADRAVADELKAVYETYARDLRLGRRQALVDRYDRRGIYLLGNGSKTLSTWEDNSRYYLTKWKMPKSFAWKDLDYEVIGPTAAAVVGRFDWQSEGDSKAATCSYSSLLLKTAGVWRIRIEDESCPPLK